MVHPFLRKFSHLRVMWFSGLFFSAEEKQRPSGPGRETGTASPTAEPWPSSNPALDSVLPPRPPRKPGKKGCLSLLSVRSLR